jgi:hypothetical protein
LTPRLTRAEHLDRIAAAIVDSIESAARGYAVRPRPSHLRKAEVRLTARYGVFTLRLKIQRDNFPSWVHLATGDAPRLIRIIREQFFPGAVVDQVVHGRPRGPHARATLLLAVARVALLTAVELIRQGGSTRVAHLQRWLAKEGYRDLRPNRREIAAALVERTLEPAWEKYRVHPPSDQALDQLYADWIPLERHQDLREARLALESTIKPWDRHPPSEDEVLRTWEERLTVDPPGQTASDFYLLTDVVTPIPEESIVKTDRTAAGGGKRRVTRPSAGPRSNRQT